MADQASRISDTQTASSTQLFYGSGRSRYKRVDYDNSGFLGNANTKTTAYIGSVELIYNGARLWNSATPLTRKRYIGGFLVITLTPDGEGR